jgi:hypothetical protein
MSAPWTVCTGCGQRVSGDSIHTCSPQLRELSDDEIADLIEAVNEETGRCNVRIFDHTKVLLRKLKEKYEREPKENN